MAVRLLPRVPAKLSSTFEKADEMRETTIDHVRRILNDHDYLKHPTSEELKIEKSLIVNDKQHVVQKNFESHIQQESGPCSSRDRKVEKAEELPNDGIEASDLCSLLDKFEEAISNSPSILTPATSPGHSGEWSEPLSVKINSHVISTDLTPPSTPPIQEQQQQKPVQNDCTSSAKQNGQKTTIKKTVAKKTTTNKGATKVDELKNVTGKQKAKISPVVLKKIAQKTVKVELAGNTKKGNNTSTEGEQKPCKRKCEGTLPETGKKVKTESTKIEAGKSSLVESEAGECSTSENSSDVGSDIERKLSNTNKHIDEKMVESQNNGSEMSVNVSSLLSVDNCGEEKLPKVSDQKDKKTSKNDKESSNNEKCIESCDVTGKKPSNTDNYCQKTEESKAHCNNNNEIELKVDACKTMNNNNNLSNVKKTKMHRCDDDDHNSNDNNIKENLRRETEQYNDEKRKRKYKSRSPSYESNSDEENSRRSRYNHKSRHTRDNERSKEKYRKYSSRDDYDEERRHRKYDARHCRKPWKNVRDIEHERKVDFRLGRSNIRDDPKGERRVIYVGGLPYGTTRDELWKRFRKFGPIEKVTVHLRVGERDNYGFVTFLEPDDARECIELGNSDPKEPRFDLCFGGRRQFCGGSYVDFDSTTSHIEELNEVYGKVCDDIPEEDDFDSLLRMCQKDLER